MREVHLKNLIEMYNIMTSFNKVQVFNSTDCMYTYSQMHRTDKYSQLSSMIWSVWPNGWVFVSELSGCGFKSSCSHLKDSMIVPNSLCLGNVSKDFSASNMKKTGFNGYIYDVSVDYELIDVDDIKNIHKYLIEKNEIVYIV